MAWFWFTPISLWVGNQVFKSVLSAVGTSVTVPYTNRRHVLLVLPPGVVKKTMEDRFSEFVEEKMLKVKLPSTHPNSERVGRIANNIIEALSTSLHKQTHTHVSHLVGVNWHTYVVDTPKHDTYSIHGVAVPPGNITVFSGMLIHLQTDAEIAVEIACQALLQLVLYQFVPLGIIPYFATVFSTYLMVVPSHQRSQLDADHIGMILMASAGYDPWVALTVHEKKAIIDGGGSALSDYTKKRTEMLATNVMKEALDIYRDVRATSAVSGPSSYLKILLSTASRISSNQVVLH